MRILHIGTEKSWRGGENQVRFLIEMLRDRGVESFAAYPENSRAYLRMRELTNCLALPSRSGYDPRSILRLVKFCRQNKIELVNAHSSAAMSLALAVKKRLPELKLVVHRRVDIPIKKNFLTRRKYLNARVDRFVAISNAIKQVLLDYGVPENKISVVRSAVDETPHQVVNKDKARYNLLLPAQEVLGARTHNKLEGAKPFVFGLAAALTREKGHDVILRACHQLAQKEQNFLCFIAGEGAYEPELKKMLQDMHLQKHVFFLGHIQNVTEFLAGLDALVMPSVMEGLGTILLEGAFAGCVLVGTRVGGIPEIIKHNETGILINVGDDKALAVELDRLMNNPDLCRQLREQSLLHARKEFSLEKMVTDNFKVYQSLLR